MRSVRFQSVWCKNEHTLLQTAVSWSDLISQRNNLVEQQLPHPWEYKDREQIVYTCENEFSMLQTAPFVICSYKGVTCGMEEIVVKSQSYFLDHQIWLAVVRYDEWHWGRFLSWVLRFSAVTIIPPWLSILISGGWIIDSLVAAVQRHSLTPPSWTTTTTKTRYDKVLIFHSSVSRISFRGQSEASPVYR
jgi:hypothetical protein